MNNEDVIKRLQNIVSTEIYGSRDTVDELYATLQAYDDKIGRLIQDLKTPSAPDIKLWEHQKEINKLFAQEINRLSSQFLLAMVILGGSLAMLIFLNLI